MRRYTKDKESMCITVTEGAPHQYWCTKELTIQLRNNQFVKLNAKQIEFLVDTLREENLLIDALGR